MGSWGECGGVMMTLLASEVKIEQDGSREQEEEDDRRMYQQQQRHHHISQPAEFGSGGACKISQRDSSSCNNLFC
jgi:hypothetical protein